MHPLLQWLDQYLSRLSNLAAQYNYARVYQIHNVRQGDSQTGLYILDDTLRYFVTFSRQSKYLFSSDTPDSGFSLRVLRRKPDNRARDRLRRRNSFEVPVATA